MALLCFSHPSWALISFSDRIQIENTQFGTHIVDVLQSAEQSTRAEKKDTKKNKSNDVGESPKRADTTTERVELKSVIDENTLKEITQGRIQFVDKPLDPEEQNSLWEKHRVIQFHRRDQPTEGNFLNGVFTIYGRSATFKNHGVNLQTKIRLRARVYLLVDPVSSTVERAAITKEYVFLEIKIKHPTTKAIGGSFKYRILLKDADAIRLFSADSSNRNQFKGLIADLKNRAISYQDKNQKKMNSEKTVNAIFDTIEEITQLRNGPEFIQPIFITNYIRESYAFTQFNYEMKYIPKQKKFWDHLVPSCFRSPVSPDEKVIKQVQYQLTVDREVRAIPQMNPNPDLNNPPQWAKEMNILNNKESLDIARYFPPRFSKKDYEVRYPKGTYAIELKLPSVLNDLPFDRKSELHQVLDIEIKNRMKDKIIQRKDHDLESIDFGFGRGKAGHLSQMLNKLVLGDLPGWAMQTLRDHLAGKGSPGSDSDAVLEPIGDED